MANIKYHSENGSSPWVCHVGKNNSIWFAYMSIWKALYRFPVLAFKFRNMGG